MEFNALRVNNSNKKQVVLDSIDSVELNLKPIGKREAEIGREWGVAFTRPVSGGCGATRAG